MIPRSSVDVLVIGAHLSGQPLNAELVAVGARLVGRAVTAPHYRLWALPTEPPKPGLLRVAGGGAAIEGERWRLPVAGFGALVAALPSPMTMGPVRLDDGSRVSGFLVESAALDGALEITEYGGWRRYLGRVTAGRCGTGTAP